jgi:hypothetical protein
MLPLLVRVKLVLLPPPGACQKFPHPARKPARSGAAPSDSRAHIPIFIAAPSLFRRAWPLTDFTPYGKTRDTVA